MRVYAIRNIGASYSAPKMNTRVQKTQSYATLTEQPVSKEVSFKNKTLTMGGVCALIGAGAAFVMSGGMAAPVAIAIMGAATGTSGVILGRAIDKVEAENKSYNS